ncbi:hypothetical protein CFC21_021992 [Triticum aestivum]|uniref:F-box domain-containing protein n=2 Tax=Triticum aestivum TaxID=4565 RepID=A0A3B6C181_WHEAT|nr:uncharacterized protein LOC123043827 [Triticum aestivum]KAF7007012.1 hypothetical protein CFC21_021992 [Triticum aestivum]
MASTPRRLEAPPTTLLTLPEELLEEVLVRLPAAADLARASVAWVSFRRLVTDHRFLRRFRARQPPPLLGIVSHRSHRYLPLLQLAQPPHPSAAGASTFAGSHAADFACSFLPSAERWHVRDLRDSHVLLSGVPEGSKFSCRVLVRDLAVCDPLYRRYTLLPAIPDDLAALARQSDMGHFEPFLAPPATEDEDGISFRVICWRAAQPGWSSSSSLQVQVMDSGALLHLTIGSVCSQDWTTRLQASCQNRTCGRECATTHTDTSVGHFIRRTKTS